MITIRIAWTGPLLVFLMVLGFAASAAAPVDGIKRLPFTAQITVKPDGAADIGDITGIMDPLAAFVRTKIAATKFIPGQRDGKAGTATTELRGMLVLVPANGDSYEVSLEGISLAPRSRDLSPPMYPRGTSRHGNENAVLLLIRIHADGSVVPVKVIHSTNAAFEKPTLDQVRKWKFEAQVFNGIPVAVEAPILVAYVSAKTKAPEPEIECVWDELRPRAEGQSCFLDTMVISKGF